ncbi:hypothetical protein ILYODFUR_014254 [Ilyodon furcidens]|uniref:Uncharacterized protein n=1 Tax=Ilyodon furcidens TaxID=33524 RepID=A0ABV0URW9_9TELE
MLCSRDTFRTHPLQNPLREEILKVSTEEHQHYLLVQKRTDSSKQPPLITSMRLIQDWLSNRLKGVPRGGNKNKDKPLNEKGCPNF